MWVEEIDIVGDVPHDKYASVEDCSDVEDVLEWAEFRLEIAYD